MVRAAGILMPITSLPSPYGIGTLGQTARDFIQFLEKIWSDILADSSYLPNRIWRFSLSVIFYLCRQSLYD